MESNTKNNSDQLFTELTAQESENVSGGWCGYYGYGYYRPVAYYYRPYAWGWRGGCGCW